MDGQRRAPAVVLLAALYLVGGALSLVGAAWPMHPDTPVDLLWALGAVGLGTGAALLAYGRTPSPAAHHAALALTQQAVGNIEPGQGAGLDDVLAGAGAFVFHAVVAHA